jgi:hypothetical protein
MQFKGLSFEKREFSHLIEDKGIKTIEGDIIDFIVSLKDRHYTLNSQKDILVPYFIFIIIMISCPIVRSC